MNDTTRALNPGLNFPAARTNRRNDGRDFQRELSATMAEYRRLGIATIEKVDPPIRVIWLPDKLTGKKAQRVIFQRNPFLDYVGCWTARNGRTVVVEAKSTASHRLPINRDGGLTADQVGSLRRWRMAGAAAAVVWRWEGAVCLFTPELINEAEIRGEKSLAFEDGRAVPPGPENLFWDFLGTLESEIWAARVVP